MLFSHPRRSNCIPHCQRSVGIGAGEIRRFPVAVVGVFYLAEAALLQEGLDRSFIDAELQSLAREAAIALHRSNLGAFPATRKG